MRHLVLLAAAALPAAALPAAAQAQQETSVLPMVPASGTLLDVTAEGRTTRVPTWRRFAPAS